jgi:hypothetical protein
MAPAFDCDCDLVIDMERMGVGPEEILQYARAVLPREDVRALIRGLQEIVATKEDEPSAPPCEV